MEASHDLDEHTTTSLTVDHQAAHPMDGVVQRTAFPLGRVAAEADDPFGSGSVGTKASLDDGTGAGPTKTVDVRLKVGL